jgi:hypothetical protein
MTTGSSNTATTCRFNACAEKMFAAGLSGVSTLRWKSWPYFEQRVDSALKCISNVSQPLGKKLPI